MFSAQKISFMIYLIMFLLGLVFSILILFLPLIFYKKNYEIQQIESGFQTIFKTSMKTFSINFFYILIIFIIFDLELIMIFSFMEIHNLFFIMFIIMFIMFTLWMEWTLNKIKWIN